MKKPKENSIVAAVKKAVQPLVPFVKKSAKDSFDAGKVIHGAKVSHKAFGTGTITAVSGNRVTITFHDRVEKQFQTPNAFLQGFLKIEE